MRRFRPTDRRRFTASIATIATAVSICALSPFAAPARAADDASANVTSRPDATSAMLTARLEGHRVEITDDETESSTTYANPDGSLTTEASQGPVRVAQDDGSFAPIDLSLTQNDDGSYSPASSVAPFTVGDGGTRTAATLPEDSGQSVGVGWTSQLPRPTVNGGTATYAITPTENLVVAATSEGFTADVVLTAPPTSDDFNVTLPLRLAKLTASQSANGTVSLKDSGGNSVASAHQFQMWDASAGAIPFPDQETAVPTQLTTNANGTPQLVLSPSMSFLTDPSTQYPVTIDPSIGSLARNGDTYWYTNNTTPEISDWRLIVGPSTSGSVVYRSQVGFDPSSVMASHVTAATLSLYQVYAASCSAQSSTAYAASAHATSSTIWSNAPGKNTSYSDSKSFNTAGPSCTPAQPYASETMDVTNIVNAWTNSTIGANGIQLWSTTESNTATGKIFCSMDVTAGTTCNSATYEPTLSVTYDAYPQISTQLAAQPSAIGSNGTNFVKSLTPTLQAISADPDGSSNNVEFQISHDPAYTSEGTGVVWTGYSTLTPQGTPATVTVPSGNLVAADHYTWQAIGYVQNSLGGYDFAATWSPTQHFQIHVHTPAAPTVSCSTFPSGVWTNTSPSGATCTATDTADGDFKGVYYAFDNPDPETPVTTSTSSATITMPSGSKALANGWHKLYVQSYDVAYARSTTTEYDFGIGVGGLSTPSDGDTTQQAVVLTTAAQSTETGVTFNYRQGTSGSWVTVPTGDVTIPGSGTHPTWPQTLSGGVSSALNWNLSQTIITAGGTDGPVQLQACFSHSGTQDGCSGTETLILAQTAFGYTQATTTVGPGSLSLLTGDLDVTTADVTISTPGGNLSLGRDLTTLGPASTDTGPTGVFGPAWTADLPTPDDGYATETLYTNHDLGFATLTGPSGAELAYLTTSSTYPYVFTGVGDANDGSVMTQSAQNAVNIAELDGTVTSWTRTAVGAPWELVSINDPNSVQPVGYTYNTAAQLTQAVAGGPGVTCTSPLTSAGCRTLTLNYATTTTATGTSQAQWGDYYDSANAVGRLKSVQFTAYDPATSAMKTVTVASYAYDNTGMLRGEWDPRISPSLETTYSYGTGDRLATITPPGLNSDTINYDSIGRVASVQWTDPANGSATQAIAYAVPVTGGGAPVDMSSSASGTWGQTSDLPYVATEVFPPDHVPSTGSGGDYAPTSTDYPYGSISYLDVNGRDVDDANYGAGAWQVAATQYDSNGNTVWQLAPNNRNQAITPTSDTDPAVAVMATSAQRADVLATTSVYAPNGYDLADTYGPMHPVLIDSGALAGVLQNAQDHTHYVYNQGAPTTGGPYDLVTETDESPYFGQSGSSTPTDYSADTRTTLTGYNPIDGSSNIGSASGWKLGEPTSTTTVMPGGGANNITYSSEYDANGDGNIIESVMPKASSPGADAYTNDTGYYTAGSNSTYPSCGSKPQWAGLACQTGPAAQPSDSATFGTMPTAVTTYNMYGEPLTLISTSGSSTKTTTATYDAAGRASTIGISDNISGANIPTTTTSYGPSTGLPTTVSSTAGTISTGYNALGQITSYQAPAATGTNTATTTYTIDGQIASVNDGKGTVAYSYDGTDSLGRAEHRGVVTSEATGVATGDTFKGAYDADGNLISETYPNTLVATTHFDNVDEPTSLAYAMGISVWATFADGYNDFGQVVSQSSPESSQAISYDQDARISQVADNGDGGCITRSYAYDADSNRISRTTYPADVNGHCSISTGATAAESYSHDQADRLTNSSYTYDNLGRTTTVPAVDTYDTSASPTNLGLTYYADDMVHSEVQDGVSDTFTLDPTQRILGTTSSSTAVTTTNIYDDGSDSPAWTSNSNGTWSRNVSGLDGNIAEVESAVGTSGAAIELENLHGDVVAVAPDSSADVGYSSYAEATEFGQPRSGGGVITGSYGWLGGKQRSSADLGGLVLMGHRLYDPAIGRFLSTDPMLGGSANSYDYCNQDPLNNVDFAGLRSLKNWIRDIIHFFSDKNDIDGTVELLHGHIKKGLKDIFGGAIDDLGSLFSNHHSKLYIAKHAVPDLLKVAGKATEEAFSASVAIVATTFDEWFSYRPNSKPLVHGNVNQCVEMLIFGLGPCTTKPMSL